MIGNSNKKSSLKINFIFNFLSQLMVIIVPLFTGPYLARVLHAEGNGQISFANSIITYFTLMANLGFTTYGQREIAKCRDDNERKNKIFWEIFIIRIIFSLFSFLFLTVLIEAGCFETRYVSILYLLSLQVIFSSFDISFYYQGIENFKSLAIRTLIVKILGITSIFLFVKSESDIWIYALSISLSNIIANLSMWPTVISKIKVKNRHFNIFKHIVPSILIFLPTLAVTIYSVFDKTMIGILSANPDYENGCYDSAYKINSIVLLIVTTISSVMSSRNAYVYKSGDILTLKNNIYMASNYVWLVGIPLILGNILLSANLTQWFFGNGYEEVPILISIMSIRFIVSGFSEIFGTQIFISIGKEKYTMYSAIIAAVINLTLNYFLIPIYGALGAAIATAVCEVVMTLILGIFLLKSKLIEIKKIFLMPIKYIIAAMLMSLCIYFVNKSFEYSVWSFILCTLVGIFVYGLSLLIMRDKFFFYLCKEIFKTFKNVIVRKK